MCIGHSVQTIIIYIIHDPYNIATVQQPAAEYTITIYNLSLMNISSINTTCTNSPVVNQTLPISVRLVLL